MLYCKLHIAFYTQFPVIRAEWNTEGTSILHKMKEIEGNACVYAAR